MKGLFIFLMAALPFSLFSQSNFYPGYVLKNNGDTLKGYINYREWTQSPKLIDFKVTKNDKNAQQFDPQAIRGFQINGQEIYVSYAGFISRGKTDFQNLQEGLDTGKVADAIFLRQITTGRFLKLYYQSDKNKTRYFIAETHKMPVELNYYEYLNNSNQVENSSVYKGQLVLYVNRFQPGNDNLINKIGQMRYSQGDLQEVVDKINGEKNAGKKRQTGRFYIGISINNTTTEVDNANGVNGVRTATSISPKINAGIDVFGNPTIQQFILRLEVDFSYINPAVKYGGISGYGSTDTYKFNQYTGTITPQLLFNIYNKDKFKIYLDAGIAFNFSAYSNEQLSYHGFVLKNPYTLESHWADFPLQVGVVLNKKLEFCFTYTGYAAYTKYVGFAASNQITSLGIKYLFGK